MALAARSETAVPALRFTRVPLKRPTDLRSRRLNVVAHAESKGEISRRTVAGLSLLTPCLLNLPMAMARDSRVWDFSADFRGIRQPLSKYEGLRTLVEKHGDEGFNLIAFPCNQFGGQAPGTSEEERAYAIKKFGFEFDVYDKIDVNGVGTHPLYRYLKGTQPDSLPSGYSRPVREKGEIEWNYTKFLIDRDGRAVRRYRPGFDPLLFEGRCVAEGPICVAVEVPDAAGGRSVSRLKIASCAVEVESMMEFSLKKDP